MPADQRRTARVALALLAVVVVLLGGWWAAHGTGGHLDPAGARSTGGSSASVAAPAPRDTSGLPTIRVGDLPPQARRTLELIAAGGPYPYPRDGVVFQNREHLLPRKAGGYYHEYTVPTPGEGDRGARRIIVGEGGERYWTADHYASFRVIVVSGIEGGGP